MRYFITRKKVKVPRYYLLLGFLGLIIFLIILLNIITNKIKDTKFQTVLLNNSLGNITENNEKNYSLFHNIFGFSPKSSSSVSNTNNNIENLIIGKEPLIYLYNTFQTDKYHNNYYSSYSINPVVTQGNLIFQEYLKKEGINSIVETKSVAKVLKENNIPYSLSYRGSRILLKEASEKNKSLKYFFDIQIASEKKEVTTVTINNETYAKVLFVVGCSNASYEKNRNLANSLNDRLKNYPDLSRGVSLRCGAGYHGFYNQDFNENVLLLEIGGSENTIAEVNRTMAILAKIMKEETNG